MRSAETHWGNREASGQESYGRFLDNRFRTYAPVIGRYASGDPIGQFGLQKTVSSTRRASDISAGGLAAQIIGVSEGGLFRDGSSGNPVASVIAPQSLASLDLLDNFGSDPAELDADEATESNGANAYSYAANSPLNFVDPMGLNPSCPNCPAPDLQKCLKACEKGVKGREKYCRSLKNPRARAGCWALVYASEAACKGWCYWNCN